MTKTLSTEDWNRIKDSFNRRDELHPNYLKNIDISDAFLGLKAPCTYTTFVGITEQIEKGQVGKYVYYMDYLTPDNPLKLSKCEIIENG